jgi:hypothetical protein
MQEKALMTRFLLELFYIRSDYQKAHEQCDVHQQKIEELRGEHSQATNDTQLDKEMAVLKKERTGVKRKIDEKRRLRDQHVCFRAQQLRMSLHKHAHSFIWMPINFGRMVMLPSVLCRCHAEPEAA